MQTSLIFVVCLRTVSRVFSDVEHELKPEAKFGWQSRGTTRQQISSKMTSVKTRQKKSRLVSIAAFQSEQ
jgi:hypothetical protein